MQGIIDLNKPTGMSSADCVAVVRRLTGMKKVGHAGTLDPMASGVLPICVGRATRIMQYLDDEKKEYICEMKLGVSTDTLDKEGEILDERPVSDEQRHRAKEVLESMTGDILQVPPAYSALKFQGKSLYKYAREGRMIEPEPRKIRIYELEVININENYVTFIVMCGRGTYVRSICRDAGEKLGCGACMTALERTQSAGLRIEDSVSLEDLKEMTPEQIEELMYPAWYPLEMKHLQVTVPEANDLIDGKTVSTDISIKGERVLAFESDRFIGICECEEKGYLRPKKIFDTVKK